MCKIAGWVANTIDPHQTPRSADLGYTVCLGLSVWIRRVGTVIWFNRIPSEILLDLPLAWANIVDPMPTAPAGAVWSVSIPVPLRRTKECPIRLDKILCDLGIFGNYGIILHKNVKTKNMIIPTYPIYFHVFFGLALHVIVRKYIFKQGF